MTVTFHIETLEQDGTYTLRLSGDMDLAAVPEFEEAIARVNREHGDLTIDLSGSTFMDSTGVRAIVRACKTDPGSPRSIRIVPGPPTIQKVFEILGLVETLPFVNDDGRPRPTTP